MSDIFNSQGIRASLSEYARERNIETPIDHLQQFILAQVAPLEAQATEFGYAGLPEFLFESKYPVYRAMPIPSIEEVPIEELAPTRLIEALNQQGEYLEIPVGDQGRFPKYEPGHKVYEALHSAVRAIVAHIGPLMLENPTKYHESYIDEAMQVVETINKTRFSTGTLSGQAHRLVDGLNVRNGVAGNHKNRPLADLGLDLIQCVHLLEQTLPFDDSEPPIDLTMQLNEYIYTKEEREALGKSDDLPPITANTKAGLPWQQNVQKGDVIPSAVFLADHFIVEVSDLLKDTLFKTGQVSNLSAAGAAAAGHEFQAQFSKKLTSLLNGKYWYLRCGMLFPKGERYDVTKLATKTRNIWSAPFVTHLLANQVSGIPMKRSLNYLTCDEYTPSLSKFAATQGGMEQLVNKLLSEEQPTALIYADNIYFYYPDTEDWYSIDLTKGEANITREMAMSVAAYLLLNGWTDEDSNPMFSYTWAIIALYVIPSCTVDSMALLKNLLLLNPGQGSGNAWTFINNHLASTILWQEWIKAGKPRPTEDMVKDLSSRTGIDFKLELYTPKLKSKLVAAKEHTLPFDNTNEPRTIVEMDMLGWDVTYTEFGATPVLNKARLFNSYVCPQPTKQTMDSGVKKNVHKYVQALSVLYVGGWAYPGLRSAVSEYVENYWNSVQNSITQLQLDEEVVLESVAEAIRKSNYSEVLELLNPDTPPHEQDWSTTLYAPKQIMTRSSKRFARRERLVQELLAMNTTKESSKEKKVNLGKMGNAQTRRLQGAIRSGIWSNAVFDNKSFVRMMDLVSRLAPGAVAAKRAKADASAGGAALVAQAYEQALNDSQLPVKSLMELWDQLLDGKMNPVFASTAYGIPIKFTNVMAAVPPAIKSNGMVGPVAFKLVTGYDMHGATASPGEIEDYMDEWQEFARRAGESRLDEELLAQATSSYLVYTEALLDQFNKATPLATKEPKRAKTLSEAQNPVTAMKIGTEASLAEIARKTGNAYVAPLVQLRNKTQKRRDTRKRK